MGEYVSQELTGDLQMDEDSDIVLIVVGPITLDRSVGLRSANQIELRLIIQAYPLYKYHYRWP